MKTIFDSESKKEILQRVDNLTSDSKPMWGKMSVGQMLTHCTRTLQAPAGDFYVKPSALRFIGRFFKKSYLYSNKPFSKNSPTAPEFVMTDAKVFNQEKEEFLRAFEKLCAGEQAVVVTLHSFFGQMTPAEWGRLMYKHLDHHLRQYGQ